VEVTTSDKSEPHEKGNYCANCGTPIKNESASYCAYCGAKA